MASKSNLESSQSQLPGQNIYPPKLDHLNWFRERNDSKLVQAALAGGLDPNTLWTEKDLELPKPTGGCSIIVSPLGDPNVWKHCNTPLHLAVLGKDYDSAEIILSYGGDIDIYNDAGKTPLHEAISYRSLDRIRFLADHGADLNRLPQGGLVPLQKLLRDGAEELFFSLLELGASLEAAGHFDWSIADLALLSSEQGILSRLMIDHAVFPTAMRCQSEASQRSQPEEFGVAARRLLAMALSNQFLPTQQMYKAYEFLLYSVDFHQGSVWDFQAVGDLIESFNTGLYKASNTPRLVLNETFCRPCLEFQSFFAKSCRNANDDPGRPPEAFELHKTRAELEVCAGSGCPLCSMVAAGLDTRKKRDLKAKRYKKNDGTTGWRVVDETPPDPGPSPVTLAVRLAGPLWLTERSRFPWITASLASSPSTTYTTFELKGLDTSHGMPEDDCSRANTTGSKHALGIAKRWLEICQNSPAHFQCQEAYRATSDGLCPPLPTRVLHVGTQHDDPFLFESSGTRAPYCILSYCWGRTENATTTKKNISKRKKGIPLSSLPALIREAILTTRSLGFEYIWIDALCIIQDDNQDWAQEASVMHELYSRADLMITSLTADDSKDHLFQPRPNQICRPIPVDLGLPKRDRPDCKDDTVFQLSVLPGDQLKKTPKIGPVHQRAWILQEQIMSTRTLYFGAGVLQWECLQDYLLEPYPSGILRSTMNLSGDYSTCRDNKLVTRGLFQLDQTHSNDQTPFKIWRAQVEQFTKREMTKPSDRIPAFLAISTSLGAVLKDEFLGGIWKGENLLESLCWRLPQPNTTAPRGPTWTWGSRSGEVDYSYVDHPGTKTRVASVISCDAFVADRSQSHVFGSITLKGTLSTFGHKSARIQDPESFDDSTGSLERCYAFDILDFEKGPVFKGFGYPVYPNGMPAKTVRLLLRPINDDEDFWTASLFQRVGIVRHVDDARRIPKGLFDETDSVTPSYWSQIVQDIQSDRVVTIV